MTWHSESSPVYGIVLNSQSKSYIRIIHLLANCLYFTLRPLNETPDFCSTVLKYLDLVLLIFKILQWPHSKWEVFLHCLHHIKDFISVRKWFIIKPGRKKKKILQICIIPSFFLMASKILSESRSMQGVVVQTWIWYFPTGLRLYMV